MQKLRKPLISLLLSFSSTGLGQVYNGEIKKAFVFVCLTFFVPFILGIYFFQNPYLFYLLTITVLCVYVCNCYDAYVSAKNICSINIRGYNRWFFYLLYFICISIFLQIVLLNTFKQNFFEAFKVSSQSMVPTLLQGDQIVVKKSSPSLVNFSNNDVVVFTLPESPDVNNVKRIIALEDQYVELNNNKLYINSKLIKEEHAKYIHAGIKNFPKTKVPKNCIFVLGDNRDMSRDSRYFTNPFIDMTRIKAKVLYVYFNKKHVLSRLGVWIF